MENRFEHITILNSRPVGAIKAENVESTTNFLNRLLADEYAVFTKALNFHWNIKGPRFHGLHTFLESIYKESLSMVNEIAERIKILGETPKSTIQDMIRFSSLSEQVRGALSENEMLQEIFSDSIQIQNSIKEFLNLKVNLDQDPGSEDLLRNIIIHHERISWMLKSHLD